MSNSASSAFAARSRAACISASIASTSHASSHSSRSNSSESKSYESSSEAASARAARRLGGVRRRRHGWVLVLALVQNLRASDGLVRVFLVRVFLVRERVVFERVRVVVSALVVEVEAVARGVVHQRLHRRHHRLDLVLGRRGRVLRRIRGLRVRRRRGALDVRERRRGVVRRVVGVRGGVPEERNNDEKKEDWARTPGAAASRSTSARVRAAPPRRHALARSAPRSADARPRREAAGDDLRAHRRQPLLSGF